ncbi:MAG TPA: DNA polymerase IV [Methylovirgula sp.]|nr:DNA polymerase IV [Methylovirgula sp.]
MTAARTYCRDCLASVTIDGSPQTERQLVRCPHCRSPRLLWHNEIDALAIAHIDCDAFYAAIEKRDAPDLRDKPLIVGGGKRGVVSTCCYIARTYGVRSAMPMFKALALCPDAIVVRPDMQKYVRIGRDIRTLMRELTPLVEPLSIDEAFLDLSGTEALHRASPALVLARFAKRIEDEMALTVSVGLSYCKFLAKIASDLDKPRGFAIIGGAEAKSFLAPRPISLLFGVGRVAEEKLTKDGFRTLGDLQERSEADLMRRYGGEGRRLWQLAQGIDARTVEPERDTKSLSAETTFATDISSETELTPILYALCEKVAGRLKNAGLAGRSVTLKLKTADFKLRTRTRSGFAPTQLPGRLFKPARDLMLAELDGTRFRLIGVAAGDLCSADEADRGDLVDTHAARDKAEDSAIDRIRAKFGTAAIIKGITLKKQ